MLPCSALSTSLQKSLPSDLFQGIPFAIFSLGDRAYGPNFCAAGRKLTVRLMQLGANLVGQPGYGDDGTPNGGVFADLDQWIEDVLLKTLGGGSNNVNETIGISSSTPQTPYHVTVRELTTLNGPSTSVAEEWQQEKYSSPYQAFFARMGGVTCYQYNELTLKRMTGTSNDGSLTAPLVGSVITNQRITAEDHDQDTRHIEVEIKPLTLKRETSSPSVETVDYTSNLPYQAGDIATVLPSNSAQQVERFLQVMPKHIQEIADCELELQYDDSVEPTAGVGFAYWPCRCTLRGWLTYCADIHALPEREDLRALSHFCSMQHEQGPEQQAKLRSLSETSESALYADYVLREKRSWAEVLYDFDSIYDEGSPLTIDFLVSLLSPIRPRDFSIASSPTEHLLEATKSGSSSSPCIKVDLCVAIVEGTTPLGRKYHGLCSDYLSRQLVPATADIEASTTITTTTSPLIRLWIKPGTFHGLPLDVTRQNGNYGLCRMSAPLLCVGAGTGVAPLRGLIREREAVRRVHANAAIANNNKNNHHPENGDERTILSHDPDCENILIFGCRKQACDFYYQTEWEQLMQEGHFTLWTAFSRDQWYKVYVQQVLQKAEEKVKLNLSRHLLDRNGSIYIAGGPSMARTVKEVIVESLVRSNTNTCQNEKQALSFLSKLQRQGRFSIEAWG